MQWVYEHSLSLVLAGLWIGLGIVSFCLTQDAGEWWPDFLQNLSADTYGALIIVTLTKKLREVGSPESKPPQEP